MRPHRLNPARERRPVLTAALLCVCVVAAASGARAWVGTPRAAQSTSPAPKDLGQVRPGEMRRQSIDGGESHVYRVALARGQYLRAVVEQDGIDLIVSFYEPGSDPSAARAKPAAYMDTFNGEHGPESVSLVAEVSGEYLLDVYSDERGATPGRYELKLEEAREPTASDLLRVKAEAAYLEARGLRRLGTPEAGKQAVAKHNEAAGLWRSLGDRYEEACTLFALGRTYHHGRGQLDADRTNHAAALDSMKRALDIFRESDDLFGQALVSNDMGAVARDLDNPRNALPFFQRSYDLYERAGDERGRAHAQNNIGHSYALLGEYREALTRYEQSLPIWQAARDRNMEANAYNNIAFALEHLGDPARALAMYQQALGIWRETGSSRLAFAYENVGRVYHRYGDIQTALENYTTALALNREQKTAPGNDANALGNAGGEANALNNIGMANADMGDTERALDYFDQSLAIYQSLNQKRGQADALDNLGYAYYLLGRYDDALARYERALSLCAEAGDRQREAYVLTHIGMLRAAGGDAPKALSAYEQAKKIQQEGGMKLGLAITLDKIANVHASAGDHARAAAAFREALFLWTDLGAGRARAESLYGFARVESARGDLAAARGLVGEAIKIVESMRAFTSNQRLRTTLLAARHDYYELDIDLKMRLGAKSDPAALAEMTEAAFESSEQARARSLLDLLTESRADIRTGVKPELAAKEGELKNRLCALSDRMLSQREELGRAQATAKAADKADAANAAKRALRLQALKSEIENLRREYDALAAEYNDVRASIRSRSPRYAQLTQPAPPKASRLRELLDEETVLLEYSLGEERSYLWAVTRERVEGHTLPGRAQIDARPKRSGSRWRLTVRESPARPSGSTSNASESRRGSTRAPRRSSAACCSDPWRGASAQSVWWSSPTACFSSSPSRRC